MIELLNLFRIVFLFDGGGVEDVVDSVSVCLDLVWILRDFYLVLEVDG